MLRRLTVAAIGVWLAASVPEAFGQDARSSAQMPLFMPSIDRSAAPTPPATTVGAYAPTLPALPSIPAVPGSSQLPAPKPPPSPALPADPMPSINALNAMGSSPLPAPPVTATSAAPQSDRLLNWSLGDYGPTSPHLAADLHPPGQELGWYADFDIGIMKPHLNAHLSTPASINGPTGAPIVIGAAPLSWTGVPEFSVGYRLDQGAGEFRLSYRFVDSAGTQALGSDALGNPAQLHTTLSVQTLDFDYIGQEYIAEKDDLTRLLFRDFRAGVGFRAAAAYFDSRASGYPVTDTHASSAFGGFGPRMFVELHQDLGRSDFQLYSRASASGVLGPILQQYDQTSLAGGATNFAAYDTHNKNIGIGIFQFETGFSWTPESLGRRLRFTAAYSWERWWNFGRTDSSDAELTLQGVVLRAEYKY